MSNSKQRGTKDNVIAKNPAILSQKEDLSYPCIDSLALGHTAAKDASSTQFSLILL